MDQVTLHYDADSPLCRYWVEYWRRIDAWRVDYRAISSTQGSREAPLDRDPDESIAFSTTDRADVQGADAVSAILEWIQPDCVWTKLYRRIPVFAWCMRWLYRFLIRHSRVALLCARFFWGKEAIPARYDLVRWLFLRMLALIYIAAFASMAVQIEGLAGAGGILPIAPKLEALHEAYGAQAYWSIPTIFWLNATDPILFGVCVAGTLGGVAILCNFFARTFLILCYVLYLSLLHACQDFTSFQWDLFLLEAGFLGIFLEGGSFIIVFLYRWLLFRFMFLGGLVKIASGDPTWRDLTALAYHYETQPLPSPLAWYAHQLPLWFHQFCVAGVLVIELLIPFFIFLPRSLRLFAAWSFLALQASIILTGNYNFFNLLTIAICVFLLDDAALRLLGFFGIRRLDVAAIKPTRFATLASALLAAAVLLSNATLAWASNRGSAPSEPWYTLMQTTLTLGIANTYGPFAVMTTKRNEIEIEASMDGQTWLAYEFFYKPGPLDRPLSWQIPHQPRLDWQMWFAALSPGQPPNWFGRLMHELSQANPRVLALFKRVPFAQQKPRWLRASYYRYRFTNRDERKATHRIWKREYLGLYWVAE